MFAPHNSAAVFIALIATVVAFSQDRAYVERSTGLQQPGLESGNTEIEFGDVNGDGHPDLVSVGDHGNPYVNTSEHGIMVWFGNGAGTWSVFQYGDFGYGGVALGDVNWDGLMDVGYGIHHNYSGQDLGDQILEVALGDGTGHAWTPYDNGLATNGEDWGMFASDFIDADNDGDLDLAAVSFGCCNGPHVYRNNGNGTWTQTFGLLGGNSTSLLESGDVNGDGHADFACGVSTGTVYFGSGSGGFALADGNLPAPGAGGRPGIALGDVNDDGRDDLAFVTAGGVGVYTWVGPGQWQNLSGALATIGAAQLTQIADMNLDGHGDVVVLFLGHVNIYAGDGHGDWQLLANTTTPAACDFAALRAGTDFDHNGYPDFAFIAEENCSPWTGGTNRLHAFAESTAPATPTIYSAEPRGGETYYAGSVHFLEWYAGVPAGAGQPTVSIALSFTGAEGPFHPLADACPNSGRYQWHVPRCLPAGSHYFLRYTLNSAPPVIVTTPREFAVLSDVAFFRGDCDCDGVVTFDDIGYFVAALGDNWSNWMSLYMAQHAGWPPECSFAACDVNGDGHVDFDDIGPFVDALGRAS